MKKGFLSRILAAFYLILLLKGCMTGHLSPLSMEQQALQIALDWNSCFLEMERQTEGFRPPVSARMYAYTGICAWEAALPGMLHAKSFIGNHTSIKPVPWQSPQPFLLPVVLNAAYAKMAAYFFGLTTNQNQSLYMSLNQKNLKKLEGDYPSEAIEASTAYGEAVANLIFEWSASDAIGHQANLYNFDKNYRPPDGPGYWRPLGPNAMPALLPYWGTARCFVVDTLDLALRPPLPFSEVVGSAFFSQAMEVYTLSRPISAENLWVAEFWSDDFAGVTFSASSRWISIASQVIEAEKTPLDKSLETWLKIGLALNDAAVIVWHEKYHFALERPASYIQRNIHKNWQPLHDTPNFPSYPSGHAAFGAASASVLSDAFGKKYQMTDNSHKGRKEFRGDPRSFGSFGEMARENAFSRLPLGVHFRMDCEEGMRIGKIIGDRICEIDLVDNVKN